jgi:thiol-disulfide isomerase/thioredoxin
VSRVRAPQLTGRGWLGTGGEQLDLGELKGKFVLLDFWTFCCINCLHVLDELRDLGKFDDVLVTVGVHSPKFSHEADADALAAAVERYDVDHPVLDDPKLETWRSYGARAWPTLVLIDPEGYIIAHMSGEGHGEALGEALEALIPEYEARGTLRRGDSPYVPPERADEALRFPSKALWLEATETLLVADAGHHSLAELGADGTVVRRIGSGERGLVDGPAVQARFAEPSGLTLLPADVAAQVGYDVVVADTVNHALRGVSLSDGAVVTVAGTGEQGQVRPVAAGPDAATMVPLSSPWDVAWDEARRAVIVAMAGVHQLWLFDPAAHTVGALAGTGNEGLLDGAAARAWMAQPSGLAMDSAGRCWIADSETSALRVLDQEGILTTAVGQGLFDFGHVDGPAAEARFQHPLGVAVLNDTSVAVADTYNGAIRVYNTVTDSVSTLATGLKEPSDVLWMGPVGDRELVAVESGANEIVPISAGGTGDSVDLGAISTTRPVLDVHAGSVALKIPFTVPRGRKLDRQFGEPVETEVSASPSDIMVSGGGTDAALERTLELREGTGVLHVATRVATCDTVGEFPACHLNAQDWGVPIRVTLDPDAATEITLPLG